MLAKLCAYAELLRVSNVLTAVADVWMGMIVATGALAPWTVSVPLTLASVCLYLSGMVLNDVFDAKRDADERPDRPVPSGRVALRQASLLGWSLLGLGILLAGVASWIATTPDLFILSVILAATVVAYNRYKLPFLMAVCRLLNVLLGLAILGRSNSADGGPTLGEAYGWLLAGHFLYITGVTYFARNEAALNRRQRLVLASVVSLTGLLICASGPWSLEAVELPTVPASRWALLWAVVAMLIGRRFAAAVLQPTPKHIQAAVGNAIQGIILVDAALAWGYGGPFWGLAIFALLPPTMLMARFIPQT